MFIDSHFLELIRYVFKHGEGARDIALNCISFLGYEGEYMKSGIKPAKEYEC